MEKAQITVTTHEQCNVYDSIKLALKTAKKAKQNVCLVHEDKMILISHKSFINDIMNIYELQIKTESMFNQFREAIEKRDRKYDDATYSFDQEITRYSSLFENLQTENTNLKSEVIEEHNQFITISGELSELKKQFENIYKEKTEIINSLKEEVEKLVYQSIDHEEQSDKLKGKVEYQKRKIDSLKGQVRHLVGTKTTVGNYEESLKEVAVPIKKYTIEDLQKGICSVKNDGTLEELQKVLNIAFPDDINFVNGDAIYYHASNLDRRMWRCNNSINNYSQSVKDFLV